MMFLPLHYNPPFPYRGPGSPTNPISVGLDDVWSDVIDLPFNFCFFEGIHDNIQVGSNGNMTFKEKSTGPDQIVFNDKRDRISYASKHEFSWQR